MAIRALKSPRFPRALLFLGANLFEPEPYFLNVGRVLDTSRASYQIDDDGPKVQRTLEGEWSLIVWKANILFYSGHRLEILECYSRKLGGKVLKCLKYQFMDGQKRLIFRVDTHGTTVPLEESCHIHVGGTDEEITESCDPRLGSLRLEKINFLDVFRLVHCHLKDRKLPWEA